MDYTQLLNLRKKHPAWRLLLADSSPLIVGFLLHAFISGNRRSITQPELTTLLDDYLFHIREIYGQDSYPKAAKAYLDDWSRGDTAYLRKYYPRDSDEAEFDLTSATEKVIEWLKNLGQRQFVGTESRLLTVFQLLRELVQLTETDRELRIAELERQKAALDEEIARVRRGQIMAFDATQVKERFFQIEETAKQLLSDFREVEDNFRKLDRNVRERIATSDSSKGKLLDEIFGQQDAIQDSDQGKTFRAFWGLLMSPSRQQELSDLIAQVMVLEPVEALSPSDFLRQIRFSLLDAGEKVQRTSSLLVEQLRKYLDDQAWLENKRIMTLINQIERRAVAVKQNAPREKDFCHLADTRANIELPMVRGLFRPQVKVALDQHTVDDGSCEVSAEALYQQQYVDVARLQSNIRKALQSQNQVSLQQLSEQFPLEQGLSELLVYVNLATQSDNAAIDDQNSQTIKWQLTNGSYRKATLPTLVFTR